MIKRNIKMKINPNEIFKIHEICLMNNIDYYVEYERTVGVYVFIPETGGFNKDYEEIDANLFIRTNGTCEEINFKKPRDAFNNLAIEVLEQKLKKKNEILKKARIKRKNQREELHKLNLKLQKCISLEEHNQIIEKLKAVIEYLESKVK